MNTKATTKAEAIAYLSLACMRLQCREDFPRGRIGYIEHICSPHATKAVREDAYKMAVRGLEDTEEARIIRADIDAYYAVDEAKEAAAALGRRGGSSTSPAKRAASRANGAKGGRPCTEFHEGKVFASEGGFRVCGGVWAGGPIIKQSPWFATREEAEREAAAMLKRRAERDELDRLAGLRPEG